MSEKPITYIAQSDGTVQGYSNGNKVGESKEKSFFNKLTEGASDKISAFFTKSEDNVNPDVRFTKNDFSKYPSQNGIHQLVNNGTLYGGGVTQLCWPEDIITHSSLYNDSYTVFFISEHKDSSIVKSKRFNSDQKYVNGPRTAVGAALASNRIGSSLIRTADMGLSMFSMLAAKGAASLTGGLVEKSGILQTNIGKIAGAGMSKVSNVVVGGQTAALEAGKAALQGTAIAGGAVAEGAVATKVVTGEFSVFENNAEYQQLKVAIALPTPTIQVSEKMNWDTQSGALGTSLLELLGVDNADVNDGITDRLAKMVAQPNQSFNKVMHAANAVAIGTASGLGVGSSVLAATRKSQNTRKEQLFKDVEFRTFSFTWNLFARSKQEMANIESIIRIFRYHSFPELMKDNYLYLFPAMFDIVHYFKNEPNKHMPRHITSVCTGIDVDYSGGNSPVGIHHDGSPTHITLNVQFLEIGYLDRSMIAEGL